MRAFTSLVALAATAHAFFVIRCPSRLLEERADPIVDPGAVASHVHTISGGSGFGFETSYEQLRASSCTSCSTTLDKSVYWTPKLYFHAQNGSFISVNQAGDYAGNLGGHSIYYLFRGGPNNDPLHAFPPGFRMISGDPTKRSATDDFAGQAISFKCLNYNGPEPVPEGPSLPSVKCPNGIRLQVFFPSCWDGKNVDSADHKSHMSFPESGAYNSGPCPASHPVHMVSLFFETIYSTNDFADDWYGGAQPFVLSNGDPTGYGYHGDFINGWDQSQLQEAINTCNDQDESIDSCEILNSHTNPNDVAQQCKLPQSVDEQISGTLDALPGCNPITSGPAPAPAKPAGCVDHATVGMHSTYFTDLTKSKDWAYVGCGKDDAGDRTLNANGDVDTMTVENCVDFCSSKGYKYAGMEYAKECYCGNSIAQDRMPVQGILGNCNMPCEGDSGELCGGAAAISLYRSCAGSADCTNAAFAGTSNVTSGAATTSNNGVAPAAPAAVNSAPAASSSSSSSSSSSAPAEGEDEDEEEPAYYSAVASSDSGSSASTPAPAVVVAPTATSMPAAPAVTMTLTMTQPLGTPGAYGGYGGEESYGSPSSSSLSSSSQTSRHHHHKSPQTTSSPEKQVSHDSQDDCGSNDK